MIRVEVELMVRMNGGRKKYLEKVLEMPAVPHVGDRWADPCTEQNWDCSWRVRKVMYVEQGQLFYIQITDNNRHRRWMEKDFLQLVSNYSSEGWREV